MSEITPDELKQFAENCGWGYEDLSDSEHPDYGGFWHTPTCPSFCDYACNSGRHSGQEGERYNDSGSLPDFLHDSDATYLAMKEFCGGNSLLLGKLQAVFVGWPTVEEACTNAIRAVNAAAKARKPQQSLEPLISLTASSYYSPNLSTMIFATPARGLPGLSLSVSRK